MAAKNIKTPICGTPFYVIPSQDFFVRDEGNDAYQIESLAFVADGVEGVLDVTLEEGLVHVMVFFGSERWRESIGNPVVIDDVRYSVALRAVPVPFDDFDLASAADSLSFSMDNLAERVTRIGLALPVSVDESAPVYSETKDRFVASVSRNIRDLAKANPSFSAGFRQAVATLEIARLREEQALAWKQMSQRTQAIHRHMALVPEERARVAPWTFSSQETEPLPIVEGRQGLSVDASGVHSVNVHLADGATFVITALVDGTVYTEILRA